MVTSAINCHVKFLVQKSILSFIIQEAFINSFSTVCDLKTKFISKIITHVTYFHYRSVSVFAFQSSRKEKRVSGKEKGYRRLKVPQENEVVKRRTIRK